MDRQLKELRWQPWQGPDAEAVEDANVAYRDYLLARYPDEFARHCDPTTFEVDDIHTISGLALTGGGRLECHTRFIAS
jgi:hypothetical protein